MKASAYAALVLVGLIAASVMTGRRAAAGVIGLGDFEDGAPQVLLAWACSDTHTWPRERRVTMPPLIRA